MGGGVLADGVTVINFHGTMRCPTCLQIGALSQSVVAEEFPDGFHGHGLTPDIAATLAEVATVLDHIDNRRKRKVTGQMTGHGVKFASSRVVKLGKEWHKVEVTAETDAMAARLWGVSEDLLRDWLA